MQAQYAARGVVGVRAVGVELVVAARRAGGCRCTLVSTSTLADDISSELAAWVGPCAFACLRALPLLCNHLDQDQ